MNTILYFVKGRPTKEQTEKLFQNHPKFQRMENSVGVNGVGAGTMINDAREGSPNPALDQKSQTWFESAKKKSIEPSNPSDEPIEEPAFWYGWQTNKKPGPSDLQKPEIIEGDRYKGWIIPKVRTWTMIGDQVLPWVSLPKDPVWDGEVFRPGKVSAQYRHVAELGEEAWMILMELNSQQRQSSTLTLPSNPMKLVYDIIAINYYLGPDEFASLGVVPYEFWEIVEVLRIFTGYYDAAKLIEEQQKKTDQASE
jgi:hypothetical protein